MTETVSSIAPSEVLNVGERFLPATSRYGELEVVSRIKRPTIGGRPVSGPYLFFGVVALTTRQRGYECVRDWPDGHARLGGEQLLKGCSGASIRLDNTASRRRNGLMKRWGLGKRQPSPASRPIARSASENAATSSASHAIGGAAGAGTKAV